MPGGTLQDQLVKYLTDAHSIEQQALAQLRTAPDLVGDPELARIFREHLAETEEQERRVRERLEAHGAQPSRLKDTLMALGGKGFVLFARSQPDTTGKLTAHAYSYEHLELAGYELLARVAERAGDQQTADVAYAIAVEEGAMAERLEWSFDRAVEASLRERGAGDLSQTLVKYLVDAHSIEAQAIQLLRRGPQLAGDAEFAKLYEEHLDQSRAQQELIEERLTSHGASPSRFQDAAMRVGGLNWGAFFAAQPDTPGKLAAFAFAFEHLEIAGYEELLRVAARAGDAATVEVVRRILGEERTMANRLASMWDRAVDASLGAVGVA